MRATIIRRIEAAERYVPPKAETRTVFMLRGTDETAFLATAKARHAGADLFVVEVLPSDVADDVTAVHALIDGIRQRPAKKSTAAGLRPKFDLEAARRLAFIAARARREVLQ